jgi:hypothetical protein
LPLKERKRMRGLERPDIVFTEGSDGNCS